MREKTPVDSTDLLESSCVVWGACAGAAKPRMGRRGARIRCAAMGMVEGRGATVQEWRNMQRQGE